MGMGNDEGFLPSADPVHEYRLAKLHGGYGGAVETDPGTWFRSEFSPAASRRTEFSSTSVPVSGDVLAYELKQPRVWPWAVLAGAVLVVVTLVVWALVPPYEGVDFRGRPIPGTPFSIDGAAGKGLYPLSSQTPGIILVRVLGHSQSVEQVVAMDAHTHELLWSQPGVLLGSHDDRVIIGGAVTTVRDARTGQLVDGQPDGHLYGVNQGIAAVLKDDPNGVDLIGMQTEAPHDVVWQLHSDTTQRGCNSTLSLGAHRNAPWISWRDGLRSATTGELVSSDCDPNLTHVALPDSRDSDADWELFRFTGAAQISSGTPPQIQRWDPNTDKPLWPMPITVTDAPKWSYGAMQTNGTNLLVPVQRPGFEGVRLYALDDAHEVSEIEVPWSGDRVVLGTMTDQYFDVGDYSVITTVSGQLLVIDPATGQPVFRAVTRSAAFGEDLVYYLDGAQVVALDLTRRADHLETWRVPLPVDDHGPRDSLGTLGIAPGALYFVDPVTNTVTVIAG
jgi:hypothetical protein